MSNEEKNVKYIYGVYDTKLKEMSHIAMVRSHEVEPFFKEFASDLKSPLYYRIKHFDLYKLGVIDDNGKIDCSVHEFICNLSDLVDSERVQYQMMVEVLNYLPVGYFKMPKEMQEQVQEKITDAVRLYVEKYADVDKLATKLLDEQTESEVK